MKGKILRLTLEMNLKSRSYFYFSQILHLQEETLQSLLFCTFFEAIPCNILQR